MILNKELKETRRAKEDKNVKDKDDPQGSKSKCVCVFVFCCSRWSTGLIFTAAQYDRTLKCTQTAPANVRDSAEDQNGLAQFTVCNKANANVQANMKASEETQVELGWWSQP